MIEILDQLKNPLKNGTQAMMTNSWHYLVPEHKRIFATSFAYNIILKPKGKDLVFNPTKKMMMDCYVNAIFQDYGEMKIL